MPVMTAIGLMSGTSMDGIDAALLRTDGESHVEFGPVAFIPYKAAFRRQIEDGLEDAKAIVRREDRPGGLAAVERGIGERHAAAVKALLEAAPAEWREAEIIGFHGQTVLHRPQAGVTVQLGDGPALAAATGIPVVYDMRANDMKHGGQGAPLVPAYHAALARTAAAAMDGRLSGRLREYRRHFQHHLCRGERRSAGLRYRARQCPDRPVGDARRRRAVRRRRRHRQRRRRGPRGRRALSRQSVLRKERTEIARSQRFYAAEAEGLELADGARTLAAVSAEAILKSVEHLPAQPRLWIVCGGGRKNPHIVEDLRDGAKKAGAEVILAEDAGLRGDFIEAEAWAYLAVRSLKGLPLTFPATTGCKAAVSGGVLARP